MILVHKLKGEELWVNPDLIAMLEGNHDTVLTLVDGRHLTVADSPTEIADQIRTLRATTLALAFTLHDEGVAPAPLRLVPAPDEG